jgi:NADH-quinone oxidoreductase subunit E
MACLAHAQEEKGWLTPEAIEAVANYLDMPPMAAFEVASFYNMYDLKPVGKVQDHGLYQFALCSFGWLSCR